ncbi:HAMP domain-containing histidine kinase [Opitutia bacterium ISCC 52]|nr:HAMP domain-containing histidine kinase [Opitutae bacterium ISCC 52]
MSNNQHSQRSLVIWVIGGLLLLFFLVTAVLAIQMRAQLREQTIYRDGPVFMAVASAEVDDVRTINEGIIPPGAEEELFEVALNTSDIRGVVGVRVFTEGNKSVGGVPLSIKRGKTEPYEEELLNQRIPISRFHPEFELSDIFLFVEDEHTEKEQYPVLEIIIPLFSFEDEKVSGYAQYYLDGADVEAELAEVDRSIFLYAGGAFLFGGIIGSGILIWAFRRLRKVNELLEDRTRHLVSANHKLSMEARTAAIGAITSHLIHGLKSPLQGIRQFVTAQSNGEDADGEELVWQDAADTTERMQNLINEVIEVLQDRGGDFSYEVTLEELSALTKDRVMSYADRKSVRFSVRGAEGVEVMISNDRANLIVLILVNLIRNAVDASGNEQEVTLKIISEQKGRLTFQVADQGPGMPEAVRENLFQPVASGKVGGSGVGLSLCQELSRHLGGDLELAKTGPDGTVFELSISIIT